MMHSRMTKTRLRALALGLAVACATATAGAQTTSLPSTPSPLTKVPVTVRAPKATLTLEVARTDDERAQGLMNRTVLAAHSGMIFAFKSDAPVAFWMKDTLIPLDMIFIAADGTVRTVFAWVKTVPPGLPDDKIPNEQGRAKFVIELNAGEAAADGITVGTRLPDVPAFGIAAH